jgi:hypothetical protein
LVGIGATPVLGIILEGESGAWPETPMVAGKVLLGMLLIGAWPAAIGAEIGALA